MLWSNAEIIMYSLRRGDVFVRDALRRGVGSIRSVKQTITVLSFHRSPAHGDVAPWPSDQCLAYVAEHRPYDSSDGYEAHGDDHHPALLILHPHRRRAATLPTIPTALPPSRSGNTGCAPLVEIGLPVDVATAAAIPTAAIVVQRRSGSPWLCAVCGSALAPGCGSVARIEREVIRPGAEARGASHHPQRGRTPATRWDSELPSVWPRRIRLRRSGTCT